MTEHPDGFVPLEFHRFDSADMLERARAFHADMEARRTIRRFSDEPLPLEVLDECIATASSAPSGAHLQPWTFVVVTDPERKREIRAAAEAEERENYAGRMSEEWLTRLAPLGTDAIKPYLETAPALIVVFRHAYGLENGKHVKHYYTQESVGIACGFLLCALHHAGLATLTHTPSPMGFLQDLLDRPENERAYLLIPVGYPGEGCRVPKLERKPLDEVRIQVGPKL